MSGRTSEKPDAATRLDATDPELGWMPDSALERRLLHERAVLFAQPEAAKEAQQIQEPYVRFRLGAQEHYGIPFHQVEEIMDAGVICPVPGTPEFIRGVRNRRGEILTVLDLKEFFRPVRDEDYPDDAFLIVVRAQGILAGILVNEVIGNDEYVVCDLEKPLPAGGIRNLQHISGIYQGQVAILDMDSLFTEPEMEVSQSVGTG